MADSRQEPCVRHSARSKVQLCDFVEVVAAVFLLTDYSNICIRKESISRLGWLFAPILLLCVS